MIGRPLVGLSLDRFGRINMSVLATFIAGLGILLIWCEINAAADCNKLTFHLQELCRLLWHIALFRRGPGAHWWNHLGCRCTSLS